MLAKALLGAGKSAGAANYIEDVFSTYLYTGNGSTQTINNGIDLAGKGGLTWIKGRSGATDHALYDTARGATFDLVSNSTAAQTTQSTGLTAFSSTGFSIGSLAKLNTNAATYASWTFRKQPKFFDVVTYTGNGTTQNISHNLGSAPGFLIVKSISSAGNDWFTYHRSLGASSRIWLNATNAAVSSGGAGAWGNNIVAVAPTATQFTVGEYVGVNESGVTYVAYLFAHDAGGFGLTGTDNVISCGSYTGTAAKQQITLGYEAQWVMIKRSDAANDWVVFDNMRNLSNTGVNWLQPNTANAELANTTINSIAATATGFVVGQSDNSWNLSGGTYIYIAIRRGPMKTPTSGTSVYDANYGNDLGSAGILINSNNLVDMFIQKAFGSPGGPTFLHNRLCGAPQYLQATDILTEQSSASWRLDSNKGVGYAISRNLTDRIGWMFSRAPGFMDVVCYTGSGANRTIEHNLTVAPELWIIKGRSGATDWQVGSTALANTEYLVLNTTAGKATGTTRWNSTYPTSSVFSLGTATQVNTSTATYVAYLFATVSGVSKVGSYTGNGSSQTIACGFTAGARFVMIKRTNSAGGEWYVWDTVRGIVSGNDPHLSLNTQVAQINDDAIDPASTGFIVNQDAGTDVNVNAATYIFLAIA